MSTGKRRRWLFLLALNGLVVLASIAAAVAAELALGALLARPRSIPDGLVDSMRRLYLRADARFVQQDLEYMRGDDEVTYLMQPDVTFRFANREFDVELRSNSAGLRDDEASLVAPDVVVLGDSFAMGWGVEQGETFAQVLEAETDLRVLNAGMSSFATARQVLLLRRLDLRNVRAVVVQHFLNDLRENRAFVGRGYELAVTPWPIYTHHVNASLAAGRWLPLARVRAFLGGRPPFPELALATDEEAADLLLRIVAWSQELDGVPVLLISPDPWGEPHREMETAVAAVLAHTPELGDLARRLTWVDLREHLGDGDYFVLDPHLTASGHRRVALALAAALADLPEERTPTATEDDKALRGPPR